MKWGPRWWRNSPAEEAAAEEERFFAVGGGLQLLPTEGEDELAAVAGAIAEGDAAGGVVIQGGGRAGDLDGVARIGVGDADDQLDALGMAGDDGEGDEGVWEEGLVGDPGGVVAEALPQLDEAREVREGGFGFGAEDEFHTMPSCGAVIRRRPSPGGGGRAHRAGHRRAG